MDASLSRSSRQAAVTGYVNAKYRRSSSRKLEWKMLVSRMMLARNSLPTDGYCQRLRRLVGHPPTEAIKGDIPVREAVHCSGSVFLMSESVMHPLHEAVLYQHSAGFGRLRVELSWAWSFLGV